MAIELSNTEFRHIPKFGGELWFVKTSGSDTNDGKSPDDAFETIGAAITACSAGDAITVMAGVYTETGLDLNKNNVELWCEIGTVIDGTGTCLTVSGDNCKINRECDYLIVTPVSGQVGVSVTGDNCVFNNVKSNGTSSGNGWNLAGGGANLINCRASGIGAGNKAFYVTEKGCKLIDCGTAGSTTSYGYYFDGIGVSFANGILDGCTSRGHQSGGFYITTGVSHITLLGCSSGASDGKWRDIDNANVWSDFTFDNILYKKIDFDGNTGDMYQGNVADGTHYNLFKVTGTVKIFNIFAHVEEIMPAIASVVNLELESDNNSVDITAAAGAPDLDGLVVGAVLERIGAVEDPLLLAEPDNACVVIENADYKAPSVPIILVKDNSADTYIQMVCAAAMNGGGTGKIHWHVEWAPITDDGFIDVV